MSSRPLHLLRCISKSYKLGSSTIPLILFTDLKKQFFTVDVIDQESVVLIHNSKLIAGGTHVQAPHWRWQLQQCDGKLVVNKYLQDLHHKNNNQQHEVRIQQRYLERLNPGAINGSSKKKACLAVLIKPISSSSRRTQFPLCSNSWTTGLWRGCHYKCYFTWKRIFSKYSQLHSLNLQVGPLCLADHQSLWCSELGTPSPILFPSHL